MLTQEQRQTLSTVSRAFALASVAATALLSPFVFKSAQKPAAPPPKKLPALGKSFAVAAVPPARQFTFGLQQQAPVDFWGRGNDGGLSFITPAQNDLFTNFSVPRMTLVDTAKEAAYQAHLHRLAVLRRQHEAREAALRSRVSDGFMAYTHAAIDQGIGHNLPDPKAKDSTAAEFVYNAMQLAVKGFGGGQKLSGLGNLLAGTAAHQINAIATAGHQKRLAGGEVNIGTLKAGMIIGIEEHKSGMINKTALVYLDDDHGRLMVAQAEAGKGVTAVTARQWLKASAAKGDILQAVDFADLMASKGAAPRKKFHYDTSPDALAGADIGTGAYLRTTISAGIEEYTKDAEARGVTYSFGDDTGAQSIDCSGFVRKCVDTAYTRVVGNPLQPGTPLADFPRVSVDQFKALETTTGKVIEGDTLCAKNLCEGMIVAMDHGPEFKDGVQWDAGRERGIDHIGIIYRDSASRQLMLAESSGGIGVHSTKLEDFLERKAERGAKLFAVDLVAYAEKKGWKPASKVLSAALPVKAKHGPKAPKHPNA